MRIAVISLALAGLVSAAAANDGGITFGGSPSLLDGHPSIQMESELIKITVRDKKVFVDCTFHFKNTGKGCVVRMGFPDWGSGASDPYEGAEKEWAKTKPISVYKSFKSYVDGKATRTELIHGKTDWHAWQAKTVAFKTGQSHVVRDVYTMDVGGGMYDNHGTSDQVSYILATGASWKGNIGRSEVVVTFDVPNLKTPFNVVYDRKITANRDGKHDWDLGVNGVLCNGPAKPEVKGSTLRFVRTNWRPTEADDIDIFYRYRKLNGLN